MSHHGFSHRRGAWKNIRTNVGPFFNAEALFANGDFVRAADLRSARRQCRSDGSEPRENAARIGTRSRYCGGLVFAERRSSRAASRRIQAVSGEGRPWDIRSGGCPYTEESLIAGAFAELHGNVHLFPAAVQRYLHGIAWPLPVEQHVHVELIRNLL